MKNNTKSFSIAIIAVCALALSLPFVVSADDVFVPTVDESGFETSENLDPVFVTATNESGSGTSEGESIFLPSVDASGSGTLEGPNSVFIPVVDESGSDTTEGVMLIMPIANDTNVGASQVVSGASSRSGGRSGGRSNPSVSVPQEIVSLASGVIVCPYISKFILVGGKNDAGEVARLQNFLNVSEGTTLVADGLYNKATQDAVGSFQVKYASEILAPWNVAVASKNVFLTTKKKINEIVCGAGLFTLTPAELSRISASFEVPPVASSSTNGVIIGSIVGTSTLAAVNVDDNAAAAFFTGGLIEKFFKFIKGIFTGSN